LYNENNTPLVKEKRITNKEAPIEIWYQSFRIILTPTKRRIIISEYLTYWNFSIIPERKKYKFRKPRIAKILEVKTIKGSLVIEKIAGIESTAKRISVNSITINVAKRAVATFLESFVIKYLPL
jgi:hypothetical protein